MSNSIPYCKGNVSYIFWKKRKEVNLYSSQDLPNRVSQKPPSDPLRLFRPFIPLGSHEHEGRVDDRLEHAKYSTNRHERGKRAGSSRRHQHRSPENHTDRDELANGKPLQASDDDRLGHQIGYSLFSRRPALELIAPRLTEIEYGAAGPAILTARDMLRALSVTKDHCNLLYSTSLHTLSFLRP